MTHHNPSPETLARIEAAFAPINRAARQGTYMEALGDPDLTRRYLENEKSTDHYVQSVLSRLFTPTPAALSFGAHARLSRTKPKGPRH